MVNSHLRRRSQPSLGARSGHDSSAAVTVVGGLLSATRFDLALIGFLRVLGALMPPVLRVLLTRSAANADWHAWAAWAAGSATSLALLAADLPAHVLAGVAISAVVPVLLRLPRQARPGDA